MKCENIAADVLSEEVILKWYKDSHSSRGWSVFMDQMKKFVEWLEHAEEGKWLCDHRSIYTLPAPARLSPFYKLNSYIQPLHHF